MISNAYKVYRYMTHKIYLLTCVYKHIYMNKCNTFVSYTYKLLLSILLPTFIWYNCFLWEGYFDATYSIMDITSSVIFNNNFVLSFLILKIIF